MSIERFKYLFDQYSKGLLEETEKEELAELILEPAHSGKLEELVKEITESTSDKISFPEESAREILAAIFQADDKKKKESVHVRRMYFPGAWTWAAAALVCVLAMGAYFWPRGKESAPAKIAVSPKAPVAIPGREGAILTLADGSHIVLDSLDDGLIATGDGSKVLLENGQLSYIIGPQSSSEKPSFNTITTPKGRQYKLVLPDGTNVWLNTASSLTYPTRFEGPDRKVTVTGEAYFEVTQSGKPFKVHTKDYEVEVLGTHFNINMYDDEPVRKTTLLEGAIRLNYEKTGSTVPMAPGNQAWTYDGTRNGRESSWITMKSNVNTEEVIAWKNGNFQFEKAEIPVVMRQLARWYDVEVVYEGNMSNRRFTGKIPKDYSVSQLFELLRLSDVRCRLDGNKIVVFP